MALLTGSRLGPYEVTALIGAGGMGEVYQARDTRLNRDVALKILPDTFAANPQRLARFKREAQVLASLNHPNVAAIYGVEESAGVQALVLELVDGPTLADRIKDGPLPVGECLGIARQIAGALEAARNQGVIHRDLKPANIKVRPDGTVKVLDFGLAKVAVRELVGQVSSEAPTDTIAETHEGVIVGTVAYMSPEQARGQPLDQRTDIWAFGCVLYETLSGRSAFGGGTISDTIVRILDREPDWDAVPRVTPRPVRELLRHCLRKEMQYRLADIGVARLQLEQAVVHTARRRIASPRLGTAAAIILTLMLLAVLWWRPWNTWLIQRVTSTEQASSPSVQREPVAILIAGFQDATDDADFDGTVELTVKRALEGASFIFVHDRQGLGRTLGLRPPETLDDATAQEIAVKQGIAVVLSGAVKSEGRGYKLSIRAVRSANQGLIVDTQDSASSKQGVLAAATTLAARIRRALGDSELDSAQRSELATLSATPFNVIREYAGALEAASRSRFDDAQKRFSNALALDPKFGLGYAGMATTLRNLDRHEDAKKYVNDAIEQLDGMTQRERLRTRGLASFMTSNYESCVKDYSELVARYPGEAPARNNLALCSSYLRDWPGALAQMRELVKTFPRRALYRTNLAFYLSYATDFQAAEQEALALQDQDVFGLLALALAQVGQGQLTQAAATYRALGAIGNEERSIAASGLGDLAVHEGRFGDAIGTLDRGAADDLASKNSDRAAKKLVALAYAQLSRGQTRLATAAADKALAHSQLGSIRFRAARVYVASGAVGKARTEAARISLGTFLSSRPGESATGHAAEAEAYAKIVEAELALASDDPRLAIKLLTEANTARDTWLGHFTLGLAFLKVPAFAQAAAEFDLCVRRRGEVTALFFDEEPTYGLFPPALYYQGLARQGLNRADFAESFRAYLSLRGKSTEDPIVRDIQKRLSS